MANTYTWEISGFKVNPESNGQKNIVTSVRYRVSATDGTVNLIENLSVNVPYVESGSFTKFEQLNKSQVVQWVKDALGSEGVLKVQSELDAKIASLTAPKELSMPIPWQ
jgi:hypothetical protein